MHITFSPIALERELATLLTPGEAAWLAEQLRDAALPRDRLRIAFARAARKLAHSGDRTLAPFAGQPPWSLLELARALLVIRALSIAPASEHVARVGELFRTGELREQRSVLRILPLLPEAVRFAPLAIEACRTNTVAVFEAIAIDNPLPAAYFPELHFNQLVLKSIFLGVPVARIHGLSTRVTPELRRMVSEYASERRAAGRATPPDVCLVLAAAHHRSSPR